MAFIDMTQIIIKMFKNPLKYQSGGSTPTQQQQDQLVRLFQAAAQNAQVDPEALVKKAQELGQDENAAAQFMEGLQRCAQGDPAGIQFIKSLFTSSNKRGGKIQDFICKHGKGGAVAGCGCGGTVEKAERGYKVQNGSYSAQVNGQGDTTRIKVYPTTTQIMQTYPNGAVRYTTADNRSDFTTSRWDMRNGQPNLLQRIIYGNRRATPFDKENWKAIIGNHPEDPRNVLKQEEGGKVEMGKDGISRLEALNNAKAIYGYNDSQARLAYTSMKNALRRQGLRGNALRQRAREILSQRRELEAIEPNTTLQGIAVPTTPTGESLPKETLAGGTTFTERNFDKMSFANAFRANRNILGDNQVFNWRGNRYSTQLAAGNSANNKRNTEYAIPGLEPVVINDQEVIIPEYEPLQVEQVSTPTVAEILYPGLTYMVNSNGANLSSSWPTSTWMSNQNDFHNIFNPYRLRDKQSRVLMVGSPALYNPSPMAFKDGGNLIKNQAMISQGKPRSKIALAIDNNSKARNFIKGTKRFVNSPMVRLPLAGAAAYGAWKLAGILPEAEIVPAKYASMMFLSQLRPKFILDTINPLKDSKPEKASDVFWAANKIK